MRSTFRGRRNIILAELECYFSWQAQHFVKIWEIARAGNVVFFPTKCVSSLRDGTGKVSRATGAR